MEENKNKEFYFEVTKIELREIKLKKNYILKLLVRKW